jgi:hypothetical protein
MTRGAIAGLIIYVTKQMADATDSADRPALFDVTFPMVAAATAALHESGLVENESFSDDLVSYEIIVAALRAAGIAVQTRPVEWLVSERKRSSGALG